MMQIVVRTWSFTREGKQCFLESVEIQKEIFEKMQVWAHARKDLLRQKKYAQNESEKYSLWDKLNQEFNLFVRTLPEAYQRDTPEYLAISHLYTLYSDNPELLPDIIEHQIEHQSTSCLQAAASDSGLRK